MVSSPLDPRAQHGSLPVLLSSRTMAAGGREEGREGGGTREHSWPGAQAALFGGLWSLSGRRVPRGVKGSASGLGVGDHSGEALLSRPLEGWQLAWQGDWAPLLATSLRSLCQARRATPGQGLRRAASLVLLSPVPGHGAAHCALRPSLPPALPAPSGCWAAIPGAQGTLCPAPHPRVSSSQPNGTRRGLGSNAPRSLPPRRPRAGHVPSQALVLWGRNGVHRGVQPQSPTRSDHQGTWGGPGTGEGLENVGQT